MAAHDTPLPTGVTDIDREHALELLVVREIQTALLAGDRARALPLLARLEDVTNAHFLTEQLLMRLHAYEGYEAHQQEHDRLVRDLQELSRRVTDGAALDARQAAEHLQRWLLRHMATSDQVLGEFIAQSGVPRS